MTNSDKIEYQQDLDSRFGQALQVIAHRAGMPWIRGIWPDYTPGLGHHAEDSSDLAHEIGHFVVAAKSRRFKENYGLGHPTGKPYLVSVGFAVDEEERASLTGISLLIRVGALALAVDQLTDHSWLDSATPLAENVIRKCSAVRRQDARKLVALVERFRSR